MQRTGHAGHIGAGARRRQRGFAPRWLLFVLALALGGWWLADGTPSAVAHAPGVLVREAPLQGSVSGDPPTQIGRFRITPLHDFRLTARVLGREDYRFDDEAELSPTDLALGWGPMSDSAVLEQLEIGQSGRFYHYRWGAGGPPIPSTEIVRSSANMHLVPIDDTVAAALEAVGEGQLVRLDGWLVRADRNDGWRWISSTTREDSGMGACELVLVRHLEVLPAASVR